ncbi:MAG TPA: AmmeMemoRadiSam system protein B [bacterium]|nr:AmmeMemoRadiSam system protein B [bacterium]
MVRRAVVAGQFYNGTEASLREQVKKYIDERAKKEEVIGVLAPHAGFMFSGEVAGAVYSRIILPETFVILGPNHTGAGDPCAIMTKGQWQTPLGEVEIDSDLACKILANSKNLKEDEKAHSYEHSIEVQLPFLQYLRKEFKFVPICLSHLDLATCRDIGKAIAKVIREAKKKVVIVASSDLTHYESQEEANRKDKVALDAVIKLDPEELLNKVEELRISMCGAIPTSIMLIASKELGAKKGELVKYMTSGETSGDYRQVVGYGGALIK